MSSIDDEVLVSYLDGELPAEQAVHIENQIADDEGLRTRVEQLKQTWELLVDLPEETANEDLTRSTLEMITLEIENGKENQWKKWFTSFPFFLLALAAGAGIAGFAVGKVGTYFVSNQLVTNLHYVVDFEAFDQIGDEEWIERLGAIPNLTTAFPPDGIGDSPVPMEQDSARRQWVAQLPDEDRDILLKDALEFRDSPKKDQIRSIANRIYAASNPQEKLARIRSYRNLLSSLPKTYAAEFLALDLDDRQERVKEFVLNRMRVQYLENMPEEDEIAIRTWLNERPYTGFFESLSVFFLDEHDIPELPRLYQKLSDQAHQVLDNQSDEEKRETIELWCNAVRNPPENKIVSPEELAKQLKQLDSPEKVVERTLLQLLPEEAAREKLRTMVEQDQ